jgi:CRISPR system Cascade subunit CasC
LGQQEIAALANVVDAHWDDLSTAVAAPTPPATTEGDKKTKVKTAKQKKAEAKDAIPAEVAKKVKAIFNGGKAADVALFGRMLADQPDLSIDAACQVAHALSTNRVSMEMDFFTAVDDLKEKREEEDAGAGMLGTVEFNSACFYRYANIDLDQLTKNLQGDATLARQTVEAFLKAAIHAIPTGKQNTFAAHNPPSLVLAVVRGQGLYSLANAFEKPIQPDRQRGLVQNSVRALDTYWGRLARMFGPDGFENAMVCVDDETAELQALAKRRTDSVQKVIEEVLAQLPNGKGVA